MRNSSSLLSLIVRKLEGRIRVVLGTKPIGLQPYRAYQGFARICSTPPSSIATLTSPRQSLVIDHSLLERSTSNHIQWLNDTLSRRNHPRLPPPLPTPPPRREILSPIPLRSPRPSPSRLPRASRGQVRRCSHCENAGVHSQCNRRERHGAFYPEELVACMV